MIRKDSIRWSPRLLVEKFDQDATEWVAGKSGLLEPSGDLLSAYGVMPYETIEVEGNLLTTAGLTRLTALLIASGSPQAVTNTSARIGVGNSNTAYATLCPLTSMYWASFDVSFSQSFIL